MGRQAEEELKWIKAEMLRLGHRHGNIELHTNNQVNVSFYPWRHDGCDHLGGMSENSKLLLKSIFEALKA